MVAPPGLLGAEGPAPVERAGATRASLVNLVVTYDRSSAWDRALLRDVARRAREAGDSVSRGRGAGARPERERALHILSPIQVRYFPR
jgi:hypothetical protein